MGSVKKVDVGRKIPWIWLGLGLILLALAAAGRMLPLQAWLGTLNQRVAGFGPAGLAVFVAVYAVAAVFFVPGSVLTIGAGFAFGLLRGTVAVSLGSTLGAGLAFLVSRHLVRKRISVLAQRNEKFAAIDQAIGREGWKIILLLRLSPLIPFNLSNYLYGLTAIPFRPYLLASWVGMLPATVLYVYLGVVGKASLGTATGQGGGEYWLHFFYLVVGLAATVTVTWFVSRIAARALNAINVRSDP